ncbi:hypothetical protein Tco_0847805 [Tanacetum coccineum]
MQSPPQYLQKGSSQPEGGISRKTRAKRPCPQRMVKNEEHVHLTEEHISAQKKIEEEAKAEDARREGEWREVVTACPNKKGKGWTSIYKKIHKRMDYLCTTEADLGIDLDRPLKLIKRLKPSVQYEDHLAGTVLNEPVLEIFFRLYQGPGLDDHARTFGSLLLAEIDERNLNPLKQMRVIEQLRQ